MLAGFFWSVLAAQQSWLSVNVLGPLVGGGFGSASCFNLPPTTPCGNEPGRLHVNEKDKLASDDTELQVGEEADVLAGCSATPEIKGSKTWMKKC